MPIQSDIQSLAPGALIDLFILDCSVFGGEIYYFHNYELADVPLTDDVLLETLTTDDPSEEILTASQDIIFQGHLYTPFPIQATGFEANGRGQANRPKLTVANVNGLLSSLCLLYDDLVGAKFTRKRTFSKYLDDQPTADPTAELPEEIYYIEQKTKENRQMIEYELSGIWDLDGVMLPRRQVCATACTFEYRGESCGYDGDPVAEIDDTPTTDPDLDDCGKRVASCKLRFGETAELPYGGFPAVGRMGSWTS